MPLWTVDSIPELAHVPPEERKRLWRRAQEASQGSWQHQATVFGAVVASLLLSSVVPRGSGIAQFAPYVVLAIAFSVLHLNLTYRRSRAFLRAELRAGGRCAGCGYDMRGTPERCPECGMLAGVASTERQA